MAAPQCDAVCFLVRPYCAPISMAAVCVSGHAVWDTPDTQNGEAGFWLLELRSKVADWRVTSIFLLFIPPLLWLISLIWLYEEN